VELRVVHFGFNGEQEAGLVQRYAESQGCTYWWEGVKNDFYRAANTVKRAALVVIWNGTQHSAANAARLCRRRGIPHCFIEWGMLPQSATFFVDPKGFCGDSILCSDLSWITADDMAQLASTRADLQATHPRQDEGFVLAPLQLENDSQVLYHSPYTCMEEFIEQVEAMYPNQRIVVRPHPKSPAQRTPARAEVMRDGEFLDVARRASVVVGITSTCLYEAAILGVPVVALGDHPLRLRRPAEVDRVLAGALALRLDRETGELNNVLNRFGIVPLV
jgi:capsule polysaccharide export protein KpsC/LpsZ